ncbi:hypothetical protein LCGC14_0546030 [marine sediment metagenome]|uniref:Uncharacterized protein n=1 Tax=marine sediment metagenome TaxID=412755 RepID=A0A0F9UZK2_9ZZZZ
MNKEKITIEIETDNPEYAKEICKVMKKFEIKMDEVGF